MTTRRSLLAGAGFAAVGALALPATADTAVPSALPGATPSTGADYFGNARLTTHDGRTLRFYDDVLRGKTVMINMMYSRCEDRCPLMTHNLMRVQALLGERVGRDVHMYSITLQPEYDTPEVLAKYVQDHGVGPAGWTFLTGSAEDLLAVRYRLGFYERDLKRDGDVTRHTGAVRMGNETLNRWCVGSALGDPQLILASLRGLDPRLQALTGETAPTAEHAHHHAA